MSTPAGFRYAGLARAPQVQLTRGGLHGGGGRDGFADRDAPLAGSGTGNRAVVHVVPGCGHRIRELLLGDLRLPPKLGHPLIEPGRQTRAGHRARLRAGAHTACAQQDIRSRADAIRSWQCHHAAGKAQRSLQVTQDPKRSWFGWVRALVCVSHGRPRRRGGGRIGRQCQGCPGWCRGGGCWRRVGRGGLRVRRGIRRHHGSWEAVQFGRGPGLLPPPTAFSQATPWPACSGSG
jgi:hypothetical protein